MTRSSDAAAAAFAPPVTDGHLAAPYSLFGEILDWMLAPILFLWPLSIVVTNHVASQIADLPYDGQLATRVAALVRQVEVHGVPTNGSLPRALYDMLRADEHDTVYFQVVDARGELLVGDGDLPAVADRQATTTPALRYRDAVFNGEEVRIAYQLLPAVTGRSALLVQVAETRNKRKQIASRVITGVLLPQFAIIPLAVILVWLGLTRGLAPLNKLQLRIRQRRPDDLSPIGMRNAPDEVRPVIAALNDMMARLADNLEAQQRFIDAAAHQLKTPLTGLKTQTELALRETDHDQLRGYLQRIAGSVDRAAHLTNQLLQLARAEASHDKSRAMEPVDLEALTREVAAHCVPRALARQIDFGFEAAGSAMVIFGVPLLLREMIDNLIDNAIKYTPAGGRVTVRLRTAPTWILEVEDTGIGIAEADRARVFERFYRALGTDVDGSGLGLAIVREIAELHRARIEIEAGPTGRGTLIRLDFDNTTRINRGGPATQNAALHQ
jgi:two-component system sensor histidine kinase TctE